MQVVIALRLGQLLGLLCTCTLICTCASRPTPHLNNTGDYVAINAGRLGWSGIYINETHSDVEKQLGNRIDIHAQAFPACGQYASQIVLNHRIITLEWSGLTANPTIDAIYVDIPGNESSLTAVSIANSIIQNIPHMDWTASGDNSAQLKYTNGNIILIKNGNDNFLLLSIADCLD